jgi:nitrate reductase delta subunit
MLYSFKKSPAQAEAVARVREWTRQRFKLGEDATVVVSQVSCRVPGCPPLETVVAFWIGETRHRFKLFKPVEDVVADDLPPAWFKDALVDADFGCDCC